MNNLPFLIIRLVLLLSGNVPIENSEEVHTSGAHVEYIMACKGTDESKLLLLLNEVLRKLSPFFSQKFQPGQVWRSPYPTRKGEPVLYCSIIL